VNEESSITIPLSMLYPAETLIASSTLCPPLTLTVTRNELEVFIKDITDLITRTTRHTLRKWMVKQRNHNETTKPFDLYSCIDEIVFVGGASRVPVVRGTMQCLWRIRTDLILSRADNGTPLQELCKAVNADGVLAEDLAIKRAVLMSGALLVMDCLAMSVGLLFWSHEDMAASEEQRIFEPILHKGDNIPAKDSTRFMIVNSKQKFVSLDMYEEMRK
jgi:molecular chaperone DnaK (HSP70)